MGTEAGKLVTEMLCDMLTHATEGHTDGHRKASELGPAAISPVPWYSWRMVLGADKVFAAWLRAVNDRSMRCQVEGCHAILEAIERMEEGEEHVGEGAVAVDVQAYMKAWGLDAFSGREREDRGQTAEEMDAHVRKKQKS